MNDVDSATGGQAARILERVAGHTQIVASQVGTVLRGTLVGTNAEEQVGNIYGGAVEAAAGFVAALTQQASAARAFLESDAGAEAIQQVRTKAPEAIVDLVIEKGREALNAGVDDVRQGANGKVGQAVQKTAAWLRTGVTLMRQAVEFSDQFDERMSAAAAQSPVSPEPAAPTPQPATSSRRKVDVQALVTEMKSLSRAAQHVIKTTADGTEVAGALLPEST